MKKMLFLFLLSIPVFSVCFGQKLKENKVDEFTGRIIKSTSLEYIVNEQPMFGNPFIFGIQIERIDSLIVLKAELQLRGVFSIRKDQDLMFKLEEGKMVTLKNNEYVISERYGDRQIAHINYVIGYINEGSETLELMKNYKVAKLRIYTSDGYIDKEIKEKNQDIIKKCIEIVDVEYKSSSDTD
jgi:hypothetical protein